MKKIQHAKKDQQWYNIKILTIYRVYLSQELGWSQSEIDHLFQISGTDSSVLDFDDNWFSQELADVFHNNLVRLTGDADIAYKVGVYTTHHSAQGIVGRVMTGFLSPAGAYRNVTFLASQYSKAAILTAEEVGYNHATVKSVPAPGCVEKPYQCRNRLGILESIPTLFNLPKAVIDHSKCIHKGDESCEYKIMWIEKSYRFAALFTILFFVATLFVSNIYTGDLKLSFLLAVGTSSVVYSFLNRISYLRLTKALNEQIDALRISHETINRRHQEASLVSEINLIVNRMIPIDELCKVVTQAIHDKMGYDRVTIFLHDKTRNTLRPTAYTGFRKSYAEILSRTEFSVNPDNRDGFLAAVMNTGNSIFVRDVDKDISKVSLRSQDIIKGLNVKSFIAVPIRFENTIFGILSVDNISNTKLLTDNDRELLTSVAMPIGVSFSNAISYEKLQNSKNILEDLVSERTIELASARDDAVRANKAKSRFLANMSHELRTPLNAITGFSQLIQLYAKENKLEQLEKDIDKVLNSSVHLLALISDLLDMSKIEAGKMDLHIETINMNSMIESVREIAEELAKHNDNTVTISINDSIETIRSDEKKLKQILLNLISNACKFTKNGNIYLSVKTNDEHAGYVLFEIKDTGIGIPTEKLHRLFNDFTQVDSSTSKEFGGTGLGLSLSKQFCELMGGNIAVESEEQVGTTFSVYIPKVVTQNISPSGVAGQA